MLLKPYWIQGAPEPAEVCGRLIAEDGSQIVTEAADALVTECFTPEAAELTPGRVYQGVYPYFKPRRRPLYHIPEPDYEDEEEVLILAMLDLD